jgi:hypothetical protein
MGYRFETAILVVCMAMGCGSNGSEPAAVPMGDGGACELADPPDVVMHAGGVEQVGNKPIGCRFNFRDGCAQCSQGQSDAPPYVVVAPDDVISFSLEVGTFVVREPCTSGACSTMLRLSQLDSREVMMDAIEEDEPVLLDVSPGAYFADLDVIYETDDGDYHGGFTATFGLIVR